MRKQLQRNASRNVENTQYPQASDLNPLASDQKALSLPSFTVTQTLVNLLAEGGGTCKLFYLEYFHLGTVGIKHKTKSNRGVAQGIKPITGDVGVWVCQILPRRRIST